MKNIFDLFCELKNRNNFYYISVATIASFFENDKKKEYISIFVDPFSASDVVINIKETDNDWLISLELDRIKEVVYYTVSSFEDCIKLTEELYNKILKIDFRNPIWKESGQKDEKIKIFESAGISIKDECDE